MKAVKVILAIVLGVIAVTMVFGLVSSAIGLVMTLIKSVIGILFAAIVIGGLGWAIMRLLGRKSLTGGKTQFLP